MSQNRSLCLADLERPEIRHQAQQLRRMLWWLFLRACPVAVNGIPHRRFYLRRPKMWEYACGLALAGLDQVRSVLDFGGAATLPTYLLAATGRRVCSLDTDASLVQRSGQAARRFGWDLEACSRDITEPKQALPEAWGDFELGLSFCVIEHMSQARQRRALASMAKALSPGGRLILSFEYGSGAPGEGALRDVEAVEQLVEHLAQTGMGYHGQAGFADSGERFGLDRRHPERRFSFGLLCLEKAGQLTG